MVEATPGVLEMSTPEAGDGPTYLLLELLPGRRLDEVLPGAALTWTRVAPYRACALD